MLTLYGGNSKTWSEMTPQEPKSSLIVIRIMLLVIVALGRYYFFRSRKGK